MNGLKVTIAVPIYGVEKYIKRCAISLFEQTYNNIEYLFINDCTNDASIDILRQTMNLYPQRIPQVQIIEHKHNKGLAGARNTAVSAATGDFIMHVDGDDYVELNIVEECVIKQQNSDADIVSCNAYKHRFAYTEKMIHKNHSSAKEHCLSVLQRNDQVCIWGRLIRKSLYEDNDIKAEEGVNMGEDYQVISKLTYFASKTIVVDAYLYHYDCQNIGSYSNQYSQSKLFQSWKSFDIVKTFFEKRGHDYEDAVRMGEINILVSHLIISAKIQNGRYYYEEACKRLNKIDKRYWDIVPILRRLTLYLSVNFYIMKAYIQISRFLSHILKKH